MLLLPPIVRCGGLLIARDIRKIISHSSRSSMARADYWDSGSRLVHRADREVASNQRRLEIGSHPCQAG